MSQTASIRDRCTGNIGLCLLLALICGCTSVSEVRQFFAKSPYLGKAEADHAAQQSLMIARSLERNGKLDQAMAAYEQLLQRTPDHAVACHRLAVLQDRKGNHSAAEEWFQKALRLDAKDPEVHCDYGYCQYLREDYEEADLALRNALRLAPDMKRAHINLGLIAARSGRLNEAFHEFQQGGCSSESAYVNVAHVLMWTENWDGARQAIEYALEANPASPEAAEAMSRIARVQTPQPGEREAEVAKELANENTRDVDNGQPSKPAVVRHVSFQPQ